MGDRKGGYRVLVGKMREGERQLGKTKCRWKDNIKIYGQKAGWKYVDCTDLEQGWRKWRAVVHAVINLKFP